MRIFLLVALLCAMSTAIGCTPIIVVVPMPGARVAGVAYERHESFAKSAPEKMRWEPLK